MTKASDRVITLRPGKLAEFVTKMVPVPESETVETPADAHNGANSKTKAAQNKPRKKKPARRRKA